MSPYSRRPWSLSSCSSLPPLCILLLAQRNGRSYIILLSKNNSPLTMSAQRPPNLAVAQLLRANLSGESAIGFVKHVLATDLDLVFEVFADEEQEEAGWSDDDFCLGIEGGGVEMVHYICDRLDGAVPGQFSQLELRDSSFLGETDILKFPPTKNWRPMIAVVVVVRNSWCVGCTTNVAGLCMRHKDRGLWS